MASGKPCTTAHAYALTEQLNDLDGLGVLNPQPVQRLRFAKRLAATRTAEALHNAVFVREMAESLDRPPAAMTIQLAFPGKVN